MKTLENIRIHSELCENYNRTLRTVESRAASHPHIRKCGFLGE